MKLSGTYTFAAPRDRVWPLISDPASLVGLIPGCEKLEQVNPNEYRGQMQVLLAAVAGRYDTYVKLLDGDEPFCTHFEGTVDGPAGSIRGNALFRLAAAGDQSMLQYEGQGVISGPLGRMDSRFAEGVARSLINQGLGTLDKQLCEQAPVTAGAASVPAGPAPPSRRLTGWVATTWGFFGRLVHRLRTLLLHR